MRRILIGWMVVMFVLTSAMGIYANPGKFGGPKYGPGDHRNREMRNDCRYIIHRTAEVIFEAQHAAERGHRTFGLARAIFSQQRARDMYMDGNYADAIFFSLRARRLAIDIIRANRGRVRPEFFPDQMELRYEHRSPDDHDLDRRLDTDRGRMGRDDDAVHFRIELDLRN